MDAPLPGLRDVLVEEREVSRDRSPLTVADEDVLRAALQRGPLQELVIAQRLVGEVHPDVAEHRTDGRFRVRGAERVFFWKPPLEMPAELGHTGQTVGPGDRPSEAPPPAAAS